MPRRLRVASGGYAYHVLNRAVGRARIFRKGRDYEAFEEVIAEAKDRSIKVDSSRSPSRKTNIC